MKSDWEDALRGMMRLGKSAVGAGTMIDLTRRVLDGDRAVLVDLTIAMTSESRQARVTDRKEIVFRRR